MVNIFVLRRVAVDDEVCCHCSVAAYLSQVEHDGAYTSPLML